MIYGETRVEELNEYNLKFVFSIYQLTPFHEVEQYMDTDADLSKKLHISCTSNNNILILQKYSYLEMLIVMFRKVKREYDNSF